MSEKKQRAGLEYLDAWWFTNRVMIPSAWRLAAGTIALSIRIPTSIVLAGARLVQRKRTRIRW